MEIVKRKVGRPKKEENLKAERPKKAGRPKKTAKKKVTRVKVNKYTIAGLMRCNGSVFIDTTVKWNGKMFGRMEQSNGSVTLYEKNKKVGTTFSWPKLFRILMENA